MNGEAHHSFRDLMNVMKPELLPYNQHLDLNEGAGEKSTFLALPIKRNARTVPNRVVKSLFTQAKEFLEKKDVNHEVKGVNVPDLPSESFTYLDFESALMPYIAETNAYENAKAEQILEDHENQLKLEDYYFEETTMNHKGGHDKPPLVESNTISKSQWYSMNQLRIHAGCPERSINGIKKLAKYYAQLQYLENKFPFETGKVKVGFVWYEAWSRLDASSQTITQCIQYEKACTLFNVAATYSQLGAAERLWSKDGQKKASSYFQKAAGVLIFIRDSLCQRFQVKLPITSDLNETSLSALSTFMLAQAAECYYDKASDVESTSSLTSVIAIYASDLYDVASRFTKDSTNVLQQQRFSRDWTQQMKAKYFMFAAIAHFHTGPSTNTDRAIAERLARLSIANRLITTSVGYAQEVGGILYQTILGYAQNFKTAELCLQTANDAELHETPYDTRLLGPLRRPPEALVNPIAPDSVMEMAEQSADILQSLISNDYHLALQDVLTESRKVSLAGQLRLKGLIEKYGKPIPSIGDLPTAIIDEAKYQKLKIDANSLFTHLDSHQNEQRVLLSKDILACMRKIDHYTSGNLDESSKLIKQLIKDPKVKEQHSITLTNLRNIQSMIAEQQSERQNNANKIQEFEEMFKKDMEDFYALDWNKEKLASLIPVLTEDHKSLTDIRNGWNERVKLIEADKATLVSLCSESEKRLVKFKQLPNNWTYNKHLPITDQIQQHKQYLKSLDIELNSLESKLAHCVTNIKGQEANMKKFLEMMKELNQQREIVSSFEDTINNCTKFRQKIILETQSLLRFRNQSCRLLFKCLELKHDDANSIKMKKDIPKDPYMIHLIEDSKLNDSFDAIPLEPVSIAALKKLLLKALILPLDTFVEHQNTFLDFWQDIHEMSSDSKTSPSNDTPKKNEGSPQVNPILRRPVNALPPTPANHPDTMFQTIFKTLMGKKDKERKNTHIIDVDSRQGSYATALENMSDHDISELQRGGDNSLFNAMLKENAKLRSQVLNVRQDMKVEKEQKYQEMESRVKHLEKLIKKIKPKLKTGKKNQAPIESSTSASSSSDVPPNHRHHHSTKTDYKNLVSVAAAVAAGVSVANGKANQIHQGHRKPAMQRQNDERIQTRSSSESFATNMVITADYPELNKLKTRVVSSSKCTSKMPIRDDSGLEISPKGSSDSLLRGNNSDKSKILESMKLDNDRLAKLLGFL